MEYICLQSQPPVKIPRIFPLASYVLVPAVLNNSPSLEQESVVMPQLLSPLLHSQSSFVVSFPLSLRGQVPVAVADSTARKVEARRRKRGVSILFVADSPVLWDLLQASTFLYWDLLLSTFFIAVKTKQDFPVGRRPALDNFLCPTCS